MIKVSIVRAVKEKPVQNIGKHIKCILAKTQKTKNTLKLAISIDLFANFWYSIWAGKKKWCESPFFTSRKTDGEMVERFKAHAWKACEVNSLRRFKSCSLRQKSPENVGFRGFFLCSEISLLFLTLNSDTKYFPKTRKNGCFLPSNGIFPDTKFRH